MGFFSDLKEDLSQAVNELMPEETVQEEEKKVEQQWTEQSAEETTQAEAENSEIMPEFNNAPDLDAMLERVDTIAILEEKADTELQGMDFADISMSPAETLTVEEETTKEEAGTAADEMENDLEASIRAAFGENQDTDKGAERKMDYQARTVVDETAVITAGMTITGDIASEGSMDIIGTINGNIDILGKLNITGTIMGNSKAAEIYADNAKITGEVSSAGAVKIGLSSVIIGNITATSAVIAGAVKGDIDVQGPVVLDTSAIVMGNIKSKSVQINNGAVIEGMCSQCYADVNPTSFFEDYKKDDNKKTKK